MTFSLKHLILVGVLMRTVTVEGRIFTRCELAQELKSQGFPTDQLSDWVCLVESESSRNTKLTNTNTNGSTDYGLFQINDGYWCAHDGPGKDCNVQCSDLLLDDITIASRCAKIIYRRHQFTAWYGWKNRCQGALPDISSCGVL